MDLQLKGKVVLITGGSRGLGKALALGFASEGARVGICARNPGHLETAAAEVRAHGAQCVAVVADVSQAADCARAVREISTAFGGLDVLVNSASNSVDGSSRRAEDPIEDDIFIRFYGKTMATVRCSRAAVPIMRARGGGRIICIGGTSARSVFRGADSATNDSTIPQGIGNAAIANFAKQLAEEVVADRILVNVVHPHRIRTDRHAQRVKRIARERQIPEDEAEALLKTEVPIGRLLEVSDVVPLVVFLASPLSGAITGQAIAVDGGALRQINY